MINRSVIYVFEFDFSDLIITLIYAWPFFSNCITWTLYICIPTATATVHSALCLQWYKHFYTVHIILLIEMVREFVFFFFRIWESFSRALKLCICIICIIILSILYLLPNKLCEPFPKINAIYSIPYSRGCNEVVKPHQISLTNCRKDWKFE